MGVAVRSRAPELDGLRGVAILLVVVGHGGSVGMDFGGPVGVTVFFVLSGYLITRLLSHELTATGQIDLRAFWCRRALRILPAMVLPAVLAASVIGMYAGWGAALWRVAALPVSNYVAASGGEMFALGHTWSLAVEEQFYVLWPLVFAGWHRLARVRLVVLAAVLLVGLRVALVGIGRNDWGYFALDGNAGALMVGCLLALTGWQARPWVGWVGLVGVLSLSVTAWRDSVGASFVPTLAVGCGALLLCGAQGVPVLRSTLLAAVGRVSYGWYLWHFPVVWLFPADPLARWVGIGASLAVAVASWRWLERPLLRRAGAVVRPEPLSVSRRAPSLSLWSVARGTRRPELTPPHS